MLLRRNSWLFSCAAAGVLGLLFVPDRGNSEIFRKRAPVRQALPTRAMYGADIPMVSASVTSDLAVEEQVLQVLNDPAFIRISGNYDVRQNVVAPSGDSILHLHVADPAAPPQPLLVTLSQSGTNTPQQTGTPAAVRRKKFSVIQPGIQAENVRLDRIGLVVYETGQMVCTGLISDSGSPDGIIHGSDVTIKVRGYGQNLVNSPTPPSGPLYFETCKSFRCPSGRSDAISLSPHSHCESIRMHFDEITHLEVILQSRRSK